MRWLCRWFGHKPSAFDSRPVPKNAAGARWCSAIGVPFGGSVLVDRRGSGCTAQSSQPRAAVRSSVLAPSLSSRTMAAAGWIRSIEATDSPA